MNLDANKNNDLEIDALASVVSSFLKQKLEERRVSPFPN